MEKFIMADGCAVRAMDTQRGEQTIVLLHGYLEAIEVWDSVVAHLKREFRIVAIDLPGHGISEVKGEVHSMEFLSDVVAGAMREFGVERAVVVGHSMGGYVALAFAERHRPMLSGLVLLHSTPYADSELKKENRAREIELILAGKKDALARVAPGAGFAAQNRTKMREQITELEDQVYLTEDEGIVALLRGMAEREDRSELMRNLDVPELIILGRCDEYITAEVAERMIVDEPQAEVFWLENSGHQGLLEEPKAVAEKLGEFVREKC